MPTRTDRLPAVVFMPAFADEEMTIGGHRLLVVGESHFHACEGDPKCPSNASERELYHQQLTCNVVKEWSNAPHSSPLSHYVPKLFGEDKKAFWPKITFYNYLQSFAGPKARVRPKREQWEDKRNFAAFQQVLDEAKPTRVLILGKATWTNFPGDEDSIVTRPLREEGLGLHRSFGKTKEGHAHAYWYHHIGGYALALPVTHPSSRWFDLQDSKEIVQRWLRGFAVPPVSENTCKPRKWWEQRHGKWEMIS